MIRNISYISINQKNNTMKQFIVISNKVRIGLVALIAIGAISLSFQDSPFLSQKFPLQEMPYETLPEKCNGSCKQVKELDKMIVQFDRTVLEQVNSVLKNIPFASISKEVENSLKNVDLESIFKEVEFSLNRIDLKKILENVCSSLKDLD